MKDLTEQQRAFILRLVHAMEVAGAIVENENTTESTFSAQVYCVDTQSETGQYDFSFSLQLELADKKLYPYTTVHIPAAFGVDEDGVPEH